MEFLDLLRESFPSLISGMSVTLQMTLISLIIAIFLGLFACFFKLSKIKILNVIANIYVDLIRGTPMLVQVFFIYFGITQALSFRMQPMTAAVITLSLNAGAYMCEIFRSGIMAISVGQMEAARSLGLPYSKAMIKIILPQAFRIVIPSLINQFIITLKDTSILSVIGVRELVQNGGIIISRTFESFKIWAIIGVMYLIVITILSQVSKLIERRMAYGKGER